MTDNKIRIAIAEKCGWTNLHIVPFETFSKESGQITGLVGKSPDKDAWPELNPPDYPNCLNAMHEAEKVLDINIMSPSSPRYEYARQIYKIAPWNEQPIRATARLRAEAFLRVFNLWKE